MSVIETADGACLHYEAQGDGPLLVLVHGGTGTAAYDWEHLLPPLRERFRVVCPDLRGHGRSSDPENLLGIPQLADDLLALLTELCEQPAAIVAFSIGATAALSALVQKPDAAQSLVLIGASRVGEPARAPEFANGPWPQALQDLRHEHGDGPEHWRHLRNRLSSSWASLRIDESELARLQLPALVVCGDRDRIEPVQSTAELASSLPRGELFVVPGCGHFVPRQRPVELLAVLEAFLDRHR
ncbi:MAG: alpha/beta fold hydrolase [Solirubrobacteraceae bacterium]